MVRIKRKDRVLWYGIAAVSMIIILLLVAGCTSDTTRNSQNGGGSGGGLGGGSGGSSSGSYPQNIYFSFDCQGEWKSATDPAWKNHHGTFTVTGNVPFPIPYDYNNPIGYALYTDANAGRSDRSNPLHITGESQECWGTPDDCKLCHFIFDGDIYGGGLMVYNQSAPGRHWVVNFARMPGGENGIWHTNSIQQTEGGCPATDIEKVGPFEIVESSYACFNANVGPESGTSFDFSDGSGFVVSPHVDPGDYTFTSLDPRVVFHIGRAPS